MAFEPTDREREWLLAMERAEPFDKSDELIVQGLKQAAIYGDLMAVMAQQINFNFALLDSITKLSVGEQIPESAIDEMLKSQRRIVELFKKSYTAMRS